MTWGDRSIRVAIALVTTAAAVMVFAAFGPPAAADTAPAEFEFDGSDLLIDGSVTAREETLRITHDEPAAEGDTIRIELDDDHPGFEFADARDATGDDIGIAVTATVDAVEIELTDLDGDGTLGGETIAVDVDLTATDAAAGRAGEYDSAPVATVTVDETDGDLVGEEPVLVTVDPSAEVGFDADEIDDFFSMGLSTVYESGWFIIEFASEQTTVADGDKINISVDPNEIQVGHEDGFSIDDAWEASTTDHITGVDFTISNDANVLKGKDDQITITVSTADNEQINISNEAIAIGIEFAVESDSIRKAASRYRGVDLLTVDVEGEDNAELTDNADIETGTPVVLDVYPGEPDDEGFELGEIESGAEFGLGEGGELSVDGLEDRHGNEIPTAEFEFVVDDHRGERIHDGVRVAADGSGGVTLDGDGPFEISLGAFDISATVTDVSGPAEPPGDGDGLTETATDVVAYPDNVSVETATEHDDFDEAGNATIDVEVDLGVDDDDIGRVDLELVRESGDGTVTFEPGGSPTETDLWVETGYGGDGRLGRENAWAIERDLTAADFENGIRRYALDADAADRYEIRATAMPHEKAIDPDAAELDTALSEDPGAVNEDSTEIVATGPIEAVPNVSVRDDRAFVGIVDEEGGALEVELTGFEDANGHAVTDTEETLQVTFGGAAADGVSPSDGAESATVAIDPTSIDADAVGVGDPAEVAIGFDEGEQRTATDIALVHRAIERPGGTWRAGSIPQPASVYVDADGPRDVVQWEPDNGTYGGVATGGSGDALEADRIDHEDIHRGLYAYSEGGSLRIGFEYVTTADGSIGDGEIELESGWHLASSNYDLSAHTHRDLAADVNWVDSGFEDDSFAVWNVDRTDRLHDATDGIDVDGTAEPVTSDEAYWIEIDDDGAPLARSVVSPVFSEADEGEE